jgi:hypothetical protein
MTLKEAEEGDSRKRRTKDSDPNTDTRVWHRLSSRPEMLLSSTIPRIGLNAYMRRLIQGSSRTFNPLTSVLFPEALAAIQRRDRWIRSTWPLFQEAITPAAIPNALDAECLEMERTFMDNANRDQAAFDAYAAGDSEAGAAHLLDAMVVSVDKAADLETRRRAAETNNDVLLRKKRALAQGAPSSGSATDLMYALGKKEQALNNFFRTTGSSRQRA